MLKYLVDLFLFRGLYNMFVLAASNLSTTSTTISTAHTEKISYSPKSLMKVGYIVDIAMPENHLCLGALVLPSWVVTVGKCVNITTSATFLAFIQRTSGEMLYREIKYIKVHNSYMNEPRRFDIALLNLNRRFIINQNEILVMARTKINYKSCEVHTFDRNSSNVHSFSTRLVSNEKCSMQYKKFIVDTSIVCSTVSDNKACIYSMGSLLVCEKRLLGLSLDIYQCHSQKPIIYTSLAFFHPWIETYIQRLDPTAFARASSIHLSCFYFSSVLYYTYLNVICKAIFEINICY